MADAHDPAGVTPGTAPETVANGPPPGGEAVPPQDTAVTADAPVPIPPPQPIPPSADEVRATLQRDVSRLDLALAALVLVLAAVLACFDVSNGDFWLHLAAGRHLADNGLAAVGTDPFSYTAADTLWVNHSWLLDLGLYPLYSLFGGPGLVLVKALCSVLVALLMLQTRRPGQSLWLPAVCTILALLAISSRLLLQPVVVSLLFLALTVYLLFRESPGKKAGRDAALWLLPPLFALWANVDSWFFLGPLTVALVLLGEWLQLLTVSGEAAAAADRGRLKLLGLVFGAGLLACLVNPYFYHVFELPPEVAYVVVDTGGWLPAGMLPAGATLEEVMRYDPNFVLNIGLWQSPLSADYWAVTSRGLNVAGLAYFPLLLLGLASFGLLARAGGAENFPWPRVLVWTAFALLSFTSGRLILLFAVVAAPLTALNLQDYARREFGPDLLTAPRWRIWSLAGRGLTLLCCLALIVLDWPGWLHARPDDPRATHHVGWSVQEDDSAEQTATLLGLLRQQGRLGNGFSYSPDFPAYCAWLAPEEKAFFDYRWELYPGVAAEVGEMRKALREAAGAVQARRFVPASELLGAKAPKVMRDWKIDHLVFRGFDRDPVANLVVGRMLMEPEHWPLLYGDGRTAVFGWADPKNPEQARAVRALAFDPDRMAFGPREPEPNLPLGSPAFQVSEPDRWREFLYGPSLVALGAKEAVFDRFAYELGAQRTKQVFVGVTRQGRLAGAALQVGSAGLGTAPAGAGVGSWAAAVIPAVGSAVITANWQVPTPTDMGPPGLPLLALQAARRGVSARPADGDSYRALAEAISLLWQQQETYWVQHTGVEPAQVGRPLIRRLQWVGALEQCARLQPDNLDVHMQLYQYYRDMYYLDVAKEHLDRALQILENATASAEQSADLEKKRKQLGGLHKQFSEELQKRRNEYDLRASGQNMVNKFTLALRVPYQTTDEKTNQPRVDPRGFGLARQALKVLQEANPAQMSQDEKLFNLAWRLWLLLGTGEVKEALEALESPGVAAVRPEVWTYMIHGSAAGPAVVDFRAWAAAVVGDYRGYDASMADWERQLKLEETLKSVVLPMAREVALPPATLWQGMNEAYTYAFVQTQLAGLKNLVGEQRYMRGLMALENGDTAAAARHFRAARALLGPHPDIADWGILVRYSELLEPYHKGR